MPILARDMNVLKSIKSRIIHFGYDSSFLPAMRAHIKLFSSHFSHFYCLHLSGSFVYKNKRLKKKTDTFVNSRAGDSNPTSFPGSPPLAGRGGDPGNEVDSNLRYMTRC